MSNTDQNHDLSLPLRSMPRMGRRNAISYPSRILGDDDGASSPINLLHGKSASDIDPHGAIAQELRLDRINNERKSKGAVLAAAPVTSVLDGWKKLHDAKRDAFNGIERLFEPRPSLITTSISVTEAKPTIIFNETEEKDKAVYHQGKTIIPWRKQEKVKPATIAEERKKLFESFDMTSLEPPETPPISELTLRKLSKKKRRNKDHSKNSEASVASLGKFKEVKDPYAEVPAKVNTRWDEQQHPSQKINLDSVTIDKANKAKQTTAGVDEPATSTRGKTGSSKGTPAFPLKGQVSKTDIKTKIGTGFPVTEKVKYTNDKLPLTIGPRFNHKKVIGLSGNTKNRTDEDDGSLLPPTQQKTKPEVSSKHATGSALKSTFYNLQRINGAGKTNPGSGVAVNKRASSIGHFVVSKLSANILGTTAINTVTKKATVPVTSVFAAPSPFLASKVSVQNQMMDLPLNGKKNMAGTSKWAKKDTKNETSRQGKVPLQKSNNVIATQPQKNTNTTSPQPHRNINVTFQPRHTGSAQPQKNVNTTGAQKNNPTQPPPKGKVPPVQPPAKIVPMLGPVPNKYNNIYIGPYSGSDSETEQKNQKNR